MDALEIRHGVTVPAAAMTMRAVRASGPGGQNVNKVSSKVELRVDVGAIVGLDDYARARLRTLGSFDAEGRLLIVSQVTRDQRRNLEDAREKVKLVVLRALERPKRRKKTRPGKGAVERRLGDKQHRARTKAMRRGE